MYISRGLECAASTKFFGIHPTKVLPQLRHR